MLLGSGHIGTWLGRKTERDIIAACTKHLEIIFGITNQFKLFMDAYLDGDIDKTKFYAKEVVQRERDADIVKRKLIDDLMVTSLHPMDQDEIIRLVLTADDIAAHLKSATRKITYTDVSTIPESIKDGLRAIVNRLVDENVALMKAVEAVVDGSRDVAEKAEMTERIEEEIDDLRVDLLAKILKWGDNAEHVSDWLMLKEGVENIESSSDKMEDTVDVLRAIAILRGNG